MPRRVEEPMSGVHFEDACGHRMEVEAIGWDLVSDWPVQCEVWELREFEPSCGETVCDKHEGIQEIVFEVDGPDATERSLERFMTEGD